MDPPALHALDALLEHTARQLALLADARHRPDVDLVGLTRTSFEMTLKGMRASVLALRDDASLPAEVRARIGAFVAAVDAYEHQGVRLGQHLIAISAGWRCPSCGEDVARTAALSGVDAGAPFVKLELVCASCGTRSQPTPAGRKIFEEKFGHLVVPGWNPQQSGFVWDGR